jgi:hypothetical protein
VQSAKVRPVKHYCKYTGDLAQLQIQLQTICKLYGRKIAL